MHKNAWLFQCNTPFWFSCGLMPHLGKKNTHCALHTDASKLQMLDRHTEACLHCSEHLYMHVPLSVDGEFEIFQPMKDLDKFWLLGNRSDSLVCHLTTFYFYISVHRACI